MRREASEGEGLRNVRSGRHLESLNDRLSARNPLTDPARNVQYMQSAACVQSTGSQAESCLLCETVPARDARRRIKRTGDAALGHHVEQRALSHVRHANDTDLRHSGMVRHG